MEDPIGGLADCIEIARAVGKTWASRHVALDPAGRAGGWLGGWAVRRSEGLRLAVVRQWRECRKLPWRGQVLLGAFLGTYLAALAWDAYAPTEPPFALWAYPTIMFILGCGYGITLAARLACRRVRRVL